METEHLKDTILDLEKRLLRPEVRLSAEKIAELLSEEFYEFSSSGSIYYYRKNDIFDAPNAEWILRDFKVQMLAADTVLATYHSIKRDLSLGEQIEFLRSSIWKSFNGQWKIIFHQGTITSKSEL